MEQEKEQPKKEPVKVEKPAISNAREPQGELRRKSKPKEVVKEPVAIIPEPVIPKKINPGGLRKHRTY